MRPAALPAAFLAVALLLASCGSGEEPITTTTAPVPDLEISMFEWGFGPSVVELSGGATISLRLRNDGGILHEWALLAEPIEAETEYDPESVLASVSVQPGAASTITFTAPAPGTYQFICPISGHLSQGMTGILTTGS